MTTGLSQTPTFAEHPAHYLRRYLRQGDEPILISTNWHPAESLSYTMTLRREDLSR